MPIPLLNGKPYLIDGKVAASQLCCCKPDDCAGCAGCCDVVTLTSTGSTNSVWNGVFEFRKRAAVAAHDESCAYQLDESAGITARLFKKLSDGTWAFDGAYGGAFFWISGTNPSTAECPPLTGWTIYPGAPLPGTTPSVTFVATECRCTPCQEPAYFGCAICSCCGARAYRLCVSGATGDAAVVNNIPLGWVMSNGGAGGNYVFDNGTVRITLALTTHIDPFWGAWNRCRTWELHVYRRSAGAWVEVFQDSGGPTTSPSTELGSVSCARSGTVNGISYQLRPAEKFWPKAYRVTISGHARCDGECIASTYSNFHYRVNSITLDGIFEIPLAEVDQAGFCTYRLKGVGSYSYSVWQNADCSGAPDRTITGTFNLLIQWGSGSWSFSVYQSNSDNADKFITEFHTSWSVINGTPWDPPGVPASDCNCRTMAVGPLTDTTDGDLCKAWGYWNTAWVRCGHGGTATAVAIPYD